MHILLVHQAFAALDEPGGTRHHELAQYLVEKGHQVTVIASPVSYLTGAARSGRMAWVERQQAQGVTILRAFTYRALHRSFVHRVFSFLSFMASSFLVGLRVPQPVDIVWGTSPPIFQGVTAWLLARLKGARFLFEVRDLWPDFAIAAGVLRNPLLIRLSLGLERFLYRHADQLIVNSPGFIDHVKSRSAGLPALVPNGADPRMFDPQVNGRRFREKHNLGDSYVVLYAGAHGLSNDLGTALAAASLLAATHPEILLVFLGDGKDKPALMAQAAEMGLKNVRFLPSIPKTDMPEALAAADACLAILKNFPQYATVYPNKVFDYMAASRPVLLAIDGFIRQVIEQAGAGVFTPPGDPACLAQAIQILAADRAQGQAMGQRGRAYVEENFDRAVLASQLETILLNILKS